MSAYTEQTTEFKDAALLCAALTEMGITEVKVHQFAQQLEGYKGDKRTDTAEIIIPRRAVGSASNDIGFKKGENGAYKAIISEFDSGHYNADWMRRLKRSYAEQGIMLQAKKSGLKFAGKKVVDGKIKLQFVKL